MSLFSRIFGREDAEGEAGQAADSGASSETEATPPPLPRADAAVAKRSDGESSTRRGQATAPAAPKPAPQPKKEPESASEKRAREPASAIDKAAPGAARRAEAPAQTTGQTVGGAAKAAPARAPAKEVENAPPVTGTKAEAATAPSKATVLNASGLAKPARPNPAPEALVERTASKVAAPPLPPKAQTPASGVEVAAQRKPSPPPPRPDAATLRSQLDEHASAVRPLLIDMSIELRWGKAAGQFVAPVEAALNELSALAEKMGDAALKARIAELAEPLAKLKSASGTLSGAQAEELVRTVRALLSALGKEADVEAEHARRDASLVDALFWQTDGMLGPYRDRLFEAGFCTSSGLAKAEAAELAHQAGIELSLAERVISEVRKFRAAFPGAAPEPSRAREKQRLQALVQELEAQEERFYSACAGWSDDDLRTRRTLRRERARTIQKVHAILAHLGELDRLERIVRLPYTDKLWVLTTFLRAEPRALPSQV